MTTPPSFRKVNPSDAPILFISLRSATLPLSAVDEYGEVTIAQALSQIAGVAQVSVFGAIGLVEKCRPIPRRPRRADYRLDDIRNAVAKANSTTPVGGTERA